MAKKSAAYAQSNPSSSKCSNEHPSTPPPRPQYLRRPCRHRRVHVHVNFLRAGATTDELSAENEDSRNDDDHENHHYGYHRRVTAATSTIFVRHKLGLLQVSLGFVEQMLLALISIR